MAFRNKPVCGSPDAPPTPSLSFTAGPACPKMRHRPSNCERASGWRQPSQTGSVRPPCGFPGRKPDRNDIQSADAVAPDARDCGCSGSRQSNDHRRTQRRLAGYYCRRPRRPGRSPPPRPTCSSPAIRAAETPPVRCAGSPSVSFAFGLDVRAITTSSHRMRSCSCCHGSAERLPTGFVPRPAPLDSPTACCALGNTKSRCTTKFAKKRIVSARILAQ